MLVEDPNRHNGPMQFAGRSAIGTWNFVGRLRTTLSQLRADEDSKDIPTRSPNGCSSMMVLFHSGASTLSRQRSAASVRSVYQKPRSKTAAVTIWTMTAFTRRVDAEQLDRGNAQHKPGIHQASFL
jgi:hypothetical protein